MVVTAAFEVQVDDLKDFPDMSRTSGRAQKLGTIKERRPEYLVFLFSLKF